MQSLRRDLIFFSVIPHVQFNAKLYSIYKCASFNACVALWGLTMHAGPAQPQTAIGEASRKAVKVTASCY